MKIVRFAKTKYVRFVKRTMDWMNSQIVRYKTATFLAITVSDQELTSVRSANKNLSCKTEDVNSNAKRDTSKPMITNAKNVNKIVKNAMTKIHAKRHNQRGYSQYHYWQASVGDITLRHDD